MLHENWIDPRKTGVPTKAKRRGFGGIRKLPSARLAGG